MRNDNTREQITKTETLSVFSDTLKKSDRLYVYYSLMLLALVMDSISLRGTYCPKRSSPRVKPFPACHLDRSHSCVCTADTWSRRQKKKTQLGIRWLQLWCNMKPCYITGCLTRGPGVTHGHLIFGYNLVLSWGSDTRTGQAIVWDRPSVRTCCNLRCISL